MMMMMTMTMKRMAKLSLLLLFSALWIEIVVSSSNNLNGDETGDTVAEDDSQAEAATANLISLGSDPEYLVAWQDHVVFAADDGIHGKELWITNGSPNGARLLADIRPGFSHSNPSHLIAFENIGLYFAANNGHDGNELFKTDGTEYGTMLWADINPGPSSSNPSDFAVIPGKEGEQGQGQTITTSSLFFAADDGLKGVEPWILEGDTRTPKLLRDISPDGSSDPKDPTMFRDALYFSADNIANGQELWRTTGRIPASSSTSSNTAEENDTQLWSDIKSSSGSSNPSDFYVYKDNLYFAARGGGDNGLVQGRELYVNDGSRSGTKLVSDINKQLSDGEASSRPSDFCEFQDLLFFTADDGVHGRELYVTDGTFEGTRLFADIRSGPASSNPTGMTVFDGKLFFAANDGIAGAELWVVENAHPDNANDDAKLFWDINPGPASSQPAWFVVPEQIAFGERIMLFAANDGVNGRELWAATEANDDQGEPSTVMLWTDINKRVPTSRGTSNAAVAVTATASSWWSRMGFAATCMLGALMAVF